MLFKFLNPLSRVFIAQIGAFEKSVLPKPRFLLAKAALRGENIRHVVLSVKTQDRT